MASALSFKLLCPLVNQESSSVFLGLCIESHDTLKPTYRVIAHTHVESLSSVCVHVYLWK